MKSPGVSLKPAVEERRTRDLSCAEKGLLVGEIRQGDDMSGRKGNGDTDFVWGRVLF